MSSEFQYLEYLNNMAHWYPSPSQFIHDEPIYDLFDKSVLNTSRTIQPVFFTLDPVGSNPDIPPIEILEFILLSLPLEHALLFFLVDHRNIKHQLYLGLAADLEYNIEKKEIINSMYLNQEILYHVFSDAALGWKFASVSTTQVSRLYHQLKKCVYAGYLSGNIGMPMPMDQNKKIPLFQCISNHASYFLLTILRPLSACQIQTMEQKAELLCDHLSSITGRSRSISRVSSSNCSSGNTLSGSITKSSSRSRGNDRREMTIDIDQDDEADFWSREDEKFEVTIPQNNMPHPPDNAITKSRSLSKGRGIMQAASANDSCSNTKSYTCTTTHNMSEFTINFNAKFWMHYVENVQHHRYSMGLNHKMFLDNTILLSDSECQLHIIGSGISSLLTQECRFAPYKMQLLPCDHNLVRTIRNLHVPSLQRSCCEEECQCLCCLSQLVNEQKHYSGTLITGRELAFFFSQFIE